MEMTREELCRSYRQAKDKAKQIRVLADLNGMPEHMVKQILVEGGVYKEEITKDAVLQRASRTTVSRDEKGLVEWNQTLVELIADAVKTGISSSELSQILKIPAPTLAYQIRKIRKQPLMRDETKKKKGASKQKPEAQKQAEIPKAVLEAVVRELTELKWEYEQKLEECKKIKEAAAKLQADFKEVERWVKENSAPDGAGTEQDVNVLPK